MLGDWLARGAIGLAERGCVPNALLRAAIRGLCRSQLRELDSGRPAENEARLAAFAAEARHGPIALATDKANEQHYEVPASFYEFVLGPNRKYSCCLWDDGAANLAEAEEHALAATCQHTEIEDGMRVLELGCGWGSLTLWIASHYPRSHVTAVSNSHSQRRFIEAEALRRGLSDRLTVLTADMNVFATDRRFERVVSVEMFEHMRNHAELLKRIAGWLAPGGKLLVHVFCHRQFAYPFRTDRATDWLGRFFFTGGMMPSDDWLGRFADDLRVERQWRWNGRNYARTAAAWITNLDRNREQILPILAKIYGPRDARRCFERWTMLFLAGEEMFGYLQGTEWYVSHYLSTTT